MLCGLKSGEELSKAEALTIWSASQMPSDTTAKRTAINSRALDAGMIFTISNAPKNEIETGMAKKHKAFINIKG